MPLHRTKMSDHRESQVLKVLCATPQAKPIRREGAHTVIGAVAACAPLRDVHIVRLTEIKTPETFPWSMIFSFSTPDEVAASGRGATRDWCATVWAEFTRALGSGVDTTCLWTEQRAFGSEHDGAKVITSYYSFARGVEPIARDEAMAEHFDMEREQPLYAAVHFSTIADTSFADGDKFDFVFESYIDAADGIKMIYDNPMLERMRAHSRTFLDTDSRRLAFGEVEIVANGGRKAPPFSALAPGLAYSNPRQRP
jgi:hypothetical protein